MQQRRIVIVEDDPFAGRVLAMVLGDEGYQVNVAGSGAAALDQIVGRQTALVLLDMQLPDMDGFAVLAALRAARYTGPVICMSGQRELLVTLEAFRLGADDFIAKPFEPLELLARIDAVLRATARQVNGERGLRVRVDDAELDLHGRIYCSAAIESVALAPTEMRILDVLMRNAYVALDRETLNARIWGADLHGDLNRVDVYLRRLRLKIEPDPERPRYLHTVRKLGYMFRPDPVTESSDTDAADATDAHLLRSAENRS